MMSQNLSALDMDSDIPFTKALDYAEDNEQANEYLRLVLPMLARLKLAPNPINFTLCYEYVAGRNSELKLALDKVLEEASGLTKEAAITLYRHYIWDNERRNLETQRSKLRQVMSETLTGVGESADQASLSSEIFDRCSHKLKMHTELAEIREVVTEVVVQTGVMAKNSLSLKEMLTETKREVISLRDQLEQSRQEATTDALTGLLNRRAFDAEMVKATENADIAQEYLSLLMIDIDNFKQVNDTHGHLVGDKVIRFIATQLSKNVKGRDIVSRIGGEEFAILLPSTQLENARILAESIRAKIEKSQLKRMDNSKSLGSITVSIGATCYIRGESTNDFFHRADKALYRSKHAGRNKVSILL
jgi:diguanylate cyclase